MLEQCRGLAQVCGFSQQHLLPAGLRVDRQVVLLLLRSAKEHYRQFGVSLAQRLQQFEIPVQGPAPERQILGSARADVNAQQLAPAEAMPGGKVPGPL